MVPWPVHVTQLRADNRTAQRFCGVQRLAWLKSLGSHVGEGERTTAAGAAEGLWPLWHRSSAARRCCVTGGAWLRGHGAVAQAHQEPPALYCV